MMNSLYRGPVIYDLKGSVHFVFKIALQRRVGEKRERVQISKKAHRTFYIINTWPPVHKTVLMADAHFGGLHCTCIVRPAAAECCISVLKGKKEEGQMTD